MILPKKAFTLLELLIAVSIISILSAAMIPSYNSYIRSQNVKQAREQVKSDLRSLQTNAISDSLPLNMPSTGKSYWWVRFTFGSSDYYYNGTNDVISACPSSDTTNKYTLPNNVKSNADYCVIFSYQRGDNEKDNKIILKDASGNVYECIEISKAGLITTGIANSTCR